MTLPRPCPSLVFLSPHPSEGSYQAGYRGARPHHVLRWPELGYWASPSLSSSFSLGEAHPAVWSWGFLRPKDVALVPKEEIAGLPSLLPKYILWLHFQVWSPAGPLDTLRPWALLSREFTTQSQKRKGVMGESGSAQLSPADHGKSRGRCSRLRRLRR